MAIGVLSPNLASRIAAGEVIERPASVVKELVENSLDAGATRIRLEVTDGGAKSISVTDNGDGIPADEISLAFERFATSKIDETSDLSGIATLGFRGEALPSIASVARVEAVSRVDGSDSGARLVMDNGQRVAQGPAAGPTGTRIEVKGLFEKVPARRKFMGSAGRELTRIRQLVGTYAIVYPSVAFTFATDGKTRFATPGSGDSRAAIAAAYGARLADSMLKIDDDGSGAFGVGGLISDPGTSRGTRRYVTLAVNARWIENRRLAFAVEQGYHGFLPERRFPVAVLSIRTPLDDVDVNVHPAKLEVRLLREDLVFREIQRAIRLALGDFAPVRTPQHSRKIKYAGPGDVDPQCQQSVRRCRHVAEPVDHAFDTAGTEPAGTRTPRPADAAGNGCRTAAGSNISAVCAAHSSGYRAGPGDLHPCGRARRTVSGGPARRSRARPV